MIDEVLKLNNIHLSKRQKELVEREIHNPQTTNKIARYVRQVLARQQSFNIAKQTMFEMHI